jgi:hypothetical protein
MLKGIGVRLARPFRQGITTWRPPRLPLRLTSSRHMELDFYTLADKGGVLLLRYIKSWLLA